MTDEGCKELSFTHEIVFPAIEALQRRFGVGPMVVRLYPENQTEEEDWYWWSYPKPINDMIVAYARQNGLALY